MKPPRGLRLRFGKRVPPNHIALHIHADAGYVDRLVAKHLLELSCRQVPR